MKLKKKIKKIVYYFLANLSVFLVKIKNDNPYQRSSRFSALIQKLAKDKETFFNLLIEQSRPFHIQNNCDTEVHTVICHKDVNQYILCLKSFLFFSKLEIQVVLHDDSTLTKADKTNLSHHFPGIKIIDYRLATRKVLKAMKGFDLLKKERLFNDWRRFHILIMYDVLFFAQTEKIIYLDSDILFFNKPKEIVKWVMFEKNKDKTFCMHDVISAYSMSEMTIHKFFGKEIIPKFNSGLRCFWKKSFKPEVMDYMLKVIGLLNHHVLWRDQTYALIDSLLNYKTVEKFDKKYVISFNPTIKEKTVCIHYITPVRPQLYTDGIKLLTTKMCSVFV